MEVRTMDDEREISLEARLQVPLGEGCAGESRAKGIGPGLCNHKRRGIPLHGPRKLHGKTHHAAPRMLLQHLLLKGYAGVAAQKELV